MKIGIRKATTEDYYAINKLFDEIDTIHRDNLPHIFHKSSGPVRELDYYLNLISDEDIGLFVAEFEGNLVGLVHAIIRDTPDIPVFVPLRYAIIDSIVVKSDFKEHGIGRMLMDKMEDWAATNEATYIELNVYEFNQGAIIFYERLGYKPLLRRLIKKR